MGNNSFCQPLDNIENYDRSNLPKGLKVSQSQRELMETRSHRRVDNKCGKNIKHIGDGLSEVAYSDGSSYIGTLKNGLRSGKGKFESLEGVSYQGHWEHDEANGNGSLLTPQFSFEGLFKSNQAVKGRMKVFKKKYSEHYEGQLKDFKYSGKGILKVEGHSQYEGQFQNNKKHGAGKIVFESGCQYEGQFKEGYMWGQGLYQASDFRYKGEFVNNKFHGEGECTWKNRSSYKGQYIRGMRQGLGTYVSQEGNMMSGCWKKNKLLNPTAIIQKVRSLSSVVY